MELNSAMKNYELLGTVGEGAHGIVLKAIYIPDGKFVALKKITIKRLDEGVPLYILREIKALQYIEHENIVSLIDVFPQGLSFVMVLEFMSASLYDILLENKLNGAQIKTYMQMILRGLAFIHSNHIMHRDLKPANLLIAENGILKIGDFGQCRLFFQGENRAYSHQVATRWYRAPELLYGARYYDESVDIWALGCIMGEMLRGEAIFQGENDIDQLYVVISSLGTPDDSTWPGREELPDYNKISFSRTMPGIAFEEIVPSDVPGCTSFLEKFLLYDAKQRISASAAIDDQFFETDPLPCEIKDLPEIPKAKSQVKDNYFENFDSQLLQAGYHAFLDH